MSNAGKGRLYEVTYDGLWELYHSASEALEMMELPGFEPNTTARLSNPYLIAEQKRLWAKIREHELYKPNGQPF
jgi:hypothetical protein